MHRGWATIGELENLSVEDVLAANEVLDAVTAAEETRK